MPKSTTRFVKTKKIGDSGIASVLARLMSLGPISDGAPYPTAQVWVQGAIPTCHSENVPAMLPLASGSTEVAPAAHLAAFATRCGALCVGLPLAVHFCSPLSLDFLSTNCYSSVRI